MTNSNSEQKNSTKVMGRPIKWDREKIAADLLEWAKKEDSINLNKFCALYNPPIAPSYITIWAKESDDFSKAYESAKAFIAFRREELLTQNLLHVKAYDLNASTYDYFLREEKRKQAEFESKLRIEEKAGDKPSPETEANFSQLMHLLQSRNSSEINNNIERKSECETGESKTCLGSDS